MRVEHSVDHITYYERAVCYYTLPKVVSPLTQGLIVAYAVCVLEAVAALVFGLWVNSRPWTLAGAAALAGIIIFGMIAFTMRALINDIKRRSALAAARNAPEPTDDADIPDPFAAHILLSHPVDVQSQVFACVTKDGGIGYYVEIMRAGTHWRVTTPQDEPVFEIVALQKITRLLFSAPLPARLGVYANNQEIASIVRRMALRSSLVDVFGVKPRETHYAIKNGCIYASGRLVGRIYSLRHTIYLDIESEHATSGIIAHFVTLN